MSRRRLQWAWFAVTAALFVGWVAYLGRLAATQTAFGRKPVVVSRAQLLAASHLVVAEVPPGGGKAKVTETLLGKDAPAEVNLAGSAGVRGPGPYLVPLAKQADGTFRVAGLPRAPGVDGMGQGPWVPHVYPWTDDVRGQVRPWLGEPGG